MVQKGVRKPADMNNKPADNMVQKTQVGKLEENRWDDQVGFG